MLHHFKACELESSKYNLFHEINMSNEIFRKIHNNFLRMRDLDNSRNIILVNLTCENVENISLFYGSYNNSFYWTTIDQKNTTCLGLQIFFSFKFSVSPVISIYT